MGSNDQTTGQTTGQNTDKTNSTSDGLTLDELEKRSGVSGRTIRYYMLNGLLAGPSGAGQATRYPVGHVGRLRAIRMLQDEGRQLAAIRSELEVTSDDDLAQAGWQPTQVSPRTSAGGQQRLLPGLTTKHDTPSVRSQWEHFELEPGVELHVRRPLGTSANRRVQYLLRLAEKLRTTFATGDQEV